MRSVAYSILDEIRESVKQLEERGLFRMAEELMDADRIFLAGTGRCDQIMRSFAMRLMHLSLDCYVVRDVTTPAIRKGDVLVLCSLTPDHRWLMDLAKRAYAQDARIVLLSPQKDSATGDLCALSVLVPKALPVMAMPSMQAAGVVFEQCCFVLCDTLILHLSGRLNRSNETLLKNRANLE